MIAIPMRSQTVTVRGSYFAIPLVPEFLEVFAAFILKPKVLHTLVAAKQLPLIGIAMLKQAVAGEVMLAHRSLERMNRPWNQRVALFQSPEGKMKSLLVAVNVLVVEV